MRSTPSVVACAARNPSEFDRTDLSQVSTRFSKSRSTTAGETRSSWRWPMRTSDQDTRPRRALEGLYHHFRDELSLTCSRRAFDHQETNSCPALLSPPAACCHRAGPARTRPDRDRRVPGPSRDREVGSEAPTVRIGESERHPRPFVGGRSLGGSPACPTGACRDSGLDR